MSNFLLIKISVLEIFPVTIPSLHKKTDPFCNLGNFVPSLSFSCVICNPFVFVLNLICAVFYPIVCITSKINFLNSEVILSPDEFSRIERNLRPQYDILQAVNFTL